MFKCLYHSLNIILFVIFVFLYSSRLFVRILHFVVVILFSILMLIIKVLTLALHLNIFHFECVYIKGFLIKAEKLMRQECIKAYPPIFYFVAETRTPGA